MVPSIEVLDVLTSDDLDHRGNASGLGGSAEQMHVVVH
jgi:hypothetical protein